MEKGLRETFLRIYANIPLGLRRDIIAIVDEEPMTWCVCYIEITARTKIGDKTLEYLRKLKII